VQHEGTFYANLVADAPDREGSTWSASSRPYHHALEHLRPGAVRLSYANSYLNRITGGEVVDILVLLELDQLMSFHGLLS